MRTTTSFPPRVMVIPAFLYMIWSPKHGVMAPRFAAPCIVAVEAQPLASIQCQLVGIAWLPAMAPSEFAVGCFLSTAACASLTALSCKRTGMTSMREHPRFWRASSSLFDWLVVGGWCWFVLRGKYC
jgi:hypothetical protein